MAPRAQPTPTQRRVGGRLLVALLSSTLQASRVSVSCVVSPVLPNRSIDPTERGVSGVRARCTCIANGRCHSHRPLAALHFAAVYYCAQFLGVFPLPAPPAFPLSQSGFVLRFCPLVPSKVALWRLVAWLESWLHAQHAARYFYACHFANSLSSGGLRHHSQRR